MRTYHKLAVMNFLILFFAAFFGCCQSEVNAFEQNRKLGRGVNIIGYDRIWYSFQRARFKEKHFKLIKQAGLDFVRINLHPFRHMDKDNDFTLSRHWFEVLDWAVTNSLENDLTVIIDMHEFNAIGDDPEGKKEMFLSFWRQVAPIYKNAPKEVMFEILNEPCREITPELWNEYFKEALSIIRKSNPDRTVVIGPAHRNKIEYLDKLELPKKDRNIIVTIHYYEPFNFTHQGASWAGDLKDKIGVKWQGSDEEKKISLTTLKKHRPGQRNMTGRCCLANSEFTIRPRRSDACAIWNS